MLAYILYTLFIIACFILILVVLLQPGKGDAASALGGGVSGAAFGPRGTTTLLAKITIGAAVAFMTIAFSLSIPGLVTNRSVTSGIDAPAPATPAPDGSTPAPNGATPAAPSGAVPAGQITLDENGQIKTDAPAGAAPAAPAPDDAKKPATDDKKPAADAKKAAPDAKKSADQKKP